MYKWNPREGQTGTKKPTGYPASRGIAQGVSSIYSEITPSSNHGEHAAPQQHAPRILLQRNGNAFTRMGIQHGTPANIRDHAYPTRPERRKRLRRAERRRVQRKYG